MTCLISNHGSKNTTALKLPWNSPKDCNIESNQRVKMKVITEHMEHLDKHIEDIKIEVIKRCVPYSVHIENMVKITGFPICLP